MYFSVLLGLGVGLFGGGLFGFYWGFASDFGENVEEDDDADEHQADYEDGFGLDGEAGVVFGEVLEGAAFFG